MLMVEKSLNRTIRVGIDIGGTFTDFVVLRQGRLQTHKVLSVPDAPHKAIVKGLTELGLGQSFEQIRIVHGSTIVTNATLEGKGVRTAFVTNACVEDLLLLGRQTREELYNLVPVHQKSRFPHTKSFGVPVRRNASGATIEPLTDAAVVALGEQLEDFAPQAIAICLLFSYQNPADEKQLASALAKTVAAAEDMFITTASAVLPCYGEYERGVATWLNAWLGPLAKKHITYLEQAISPAPCSIMQSSGKTLSIQQAAQFAVHLLLSGPAGGVAAAVDLAKRYNRPKLLTYDMGGTSTDVSLVDGDAVLTNQGRIGPYPVAVPMLDIHTIGAGGGSIAYVDAGGMLRVGPESAASSPGPACYGNGGEHATVTDANLFLGLLLEHTFPGSKSGLNKSLAENALQKLALPLEMSVAEVAIGIRRIANENMAQSLGTISLERGRDPKEFTLCCYGGAGGLHVCALADNLAIKEILVPAEAGVFSALGMLVAPVGRELTRSLVQPMSELTQKYIDAELLQLQQSGLVMLIHEGISKDTISTECTVALRYQGQSFALPIRWSSPAQVEADFVAQHKVLYGYSLKAPVELVNLCVSVSSNSEEIMFPNPKSNASGQHTGYMQSVEYARIKYYWRKDLCQEQVVVGPALVVDTIATILIAPGWKGRMATGRCLWLYR